jgi:hypothetical protein
MELSTIKNTICSFAKGTAERVKSNWDNLSTTKKIATVAFSVLAVGVAIAAHFIGAGLAGLLSATTVLSLSASHLVAHIATHALATLGFSAPAYLFFKKEQPKPIAAKAEVVEEQLSVQDTAQPVQDAAQPGRLASLKNASVQFVRNHPRLVVAGSVLAIGVLSAGLMGPQRRDAIASYSRAKMKALPITGREFGNKILTQGRSAAAGTKKSAQNSLLRVQDGFSTARNKLDFVKKAS